MKNRSVVLAGLLFFCLAGGVQAGSVTAGTSLFQAHRWRGSFFASSAQGVGQTYLVAGVGLGYYIANGLELGMDGEAWVGSSPQIYKMTPGIRYVYSGFERVWPYLGAFYRRTFYEGLNDLNSYGGRYGAYIPVSRNAYAGVGGVYEVLSGCDDKLYNSCTSSYPEITLSLSF
jgi:hypothetical protein